MPKQIKTTHLEEATAPKAVAVENAEPLNANASEFPHEYEGAAYTAIVKNWLENKGIYGDVSEGARNTLLYALARDMRYICNFNAAYLMAVLPTWGLPANERQSAIQNAIGSPRGTEIPTTLQRAIEQAKRNDNDNDDDNRGGVEDSNPLPRRMPRLWRTICDMYPRQRKQAVLASLPALGTLLTNLRAIYPTGEEVNPIFFTIIQAPQASGKSFARELSNLLVKPIKALDAVAREELREYKRKKDAARNTKQQPEEPNVCIRLLPPTVSNAVLLKRMDNSDGKALYTFAEEIDTVNRSSSAGAWSAKSDIYRMAFDAAEWGQDYMSENSYSAIVNLRYNLLMLGTPIAVKKFFRSAEDGLVSRFIFAQLEDTAGENMEVKKPISRRTKEWLEGEVQRLHDLGTKQPELSVLIPKTALAIYQWQERMIERYNRDPDQLALDRLRRRAGNYGFRVGMIAWALMGGRETPEVIEMATWAATEIFNGQYMVQGAALQEAEENNRALAEEQHRRLNSTKENLLDRLPQEFTLTDLIAERKKNGHTGESRYIISRFIKNKLIAPIEGKKHTYKKL